MKFPREELDNLSNEEIFYLITDHADELFLEHRFDSPRKTLNLLEPWEQVIYLVPMFELEFKSGGLMKFLFSGAAGLIDEIIQAHHSIGASRTASIIQGADITLKNHHLDVATLRKKLKQSGITEGEDVDYSSILENRELETEISQLNEQLQSFYPRESDTEIWNLLENYIGQNRSKMIE